MSGELVASEVRRRVEQTREWTAWAGTRDEIRQLAKVLERSFETRRADLISQLEADDPTGGSNAENWWRERRLTSARNATRFTMSVSDGVRTATGPIDDVIDEIDRRTTTSVSMQAEYSFELRSGEELAVLLVKDKPIYGVRLSLESNDEGWARQTLSAVSEEIDKGKPWWSWLRSPAGRGLIGGLVYAILALSTFMLLGSARLRNTTVALPAVLLPMLVALPLTMPRRVANWTAPGFEIIAEGGMSSVSRRLVFAIPIALSIPIGIFVNKIS